MFFYRFILPVAATELVGVPQKSKLVKEPLSHVVKILNGFQNLVRPSFSQSLHLANVPSIATGTDNSGVNGQNLYLNYED